MSEKTMEQLAGKLEHHAYCIRKAVEEGRNPSVSSLGEWERALDRAAAALRSPMEGETGMDSETVQAMVEVFARDAWDAALSHDRGRTVVTTDGAFDRWWHGRVPHPQEAPGSWQRPDRPWSDYPVGTKARASGGGYWIKTERGWQWPGGGTFPTPGGDAVAIMLPQEAPGSKTVAIISEERPSLAAVLLTSDRPTYQCQGCGTFTRNSKAWVETHPCPKCGMEGYWTGSFKWPQEAPEDALIPHDAPIRQGARPRCPRHFYELEAGPCLCDPQELQFPDAAFEGLVCQIFEAGYARGAADERVVDQFAPGGRAAEYVASAPPTVAGLRALVSLGGEFVSPGGVPAPPSASNRSRDDLLSSLVATFKDEAERALDHLYDDELGHVESPMSDESPEVCVCERCQVFAPPILTAGAIVAILEARHAHAVPLPLAPHEVSDG